VNCADSFTASASAACHAQNLCPGGGIKGELRGSISESGDGKNKTTFPRQGGTRQYRSLCT
jgi:hypothetical protein